MYQRSTILYEFRPLNQFYEKLKKPCFLLVRKLQRERVPLQVTISHYKAMQFLQDFSFVHKFILTEAADDRN